MTLLIITAYELLGIVSFLVITEYVDKDNTFIFISYTVLFPFHFTIIIICIILYINGVFGNFDGDK